MNRVDVTELHFIAPIANVPLILKYGILSHRLAEKHVHDSVAMQEVQDRRKDKQIPGARLLHEYANLYFDAHNPMLSKRRDQNDTICILRVAHAVLDIPDVIISDRNAASDWAGFYPVAKGLQRIESDRLFARHWTHQEDQLEEWRHKSEKCAEVLVPDRVEPRYLSGAYVVNAIALATFQALNIGLSVSINDDIFF